MNYKNLTIGGLLTLLTLGSASADILRGEVYQVTDGDIYIKMADATVARVPVETANFYVDDVKRPWNSLNIGQNVMVDYEPVYGFQKYYYESADVEDPNKTQRAYMLQDVDLANTRDDSLEYEGKVYRLYPGHLTESY